ncbi:hypothetical protein BHF71_10920 [Vulcanibacillus modesticaldus]|uniref:DUF1885 domain-containing protein n=1 Tax=Vulcanibacillus modesticaldus TaxID=337097 RepID=A0A1D2YSN4_9BACI|nr:DUF1885 family protein [Vulcanibacillus modesticaldus]OEF97889.1 hypothetical protein BHF71_10920 [Vulcanibacillus modesticaldus]
MNRSIFVKLVKGSKQSEISLQQVKDLLHKYIEIFNKDGEQFDWDGYHNAVFPYNLEIKKEDDTEYLYLNAKDPLYNYILIGVGTEGDSSFIQIVIPDEDHCTIGDRQKAVEFARYLGKQLKAEVKLFNDRVMYFNPRK